MQAMGLSPSFSVTMSHIAARVVEELRNDPHPDTANLFPFTDPVIDSSVLQFRNPDLNPVDKDEFEFDFVSNGSPITADEIFSNGQIKPIYQFFNPKKTGRTPLGELMKEERETTSSSSSSESGDLETVPSGSFCVWAPKKIPTGDGGGGSGRKCRKSSSTGSSVRLKLRDLLRRSNSHSNRDGKGNLVFLPLSGKKSAAEPKISGNEKMSVEEDADMDAVSAHFAKGRSVNGGGGREAVSEYFAKRRSYLRHKQDLSLF